MSGDLAKAKALLKDNPELVFSRATTGATRLHWADEIGMTPLHVAAQNGSKDVAELLLANKADVNDKDLING